MARKKPTERRDMLQPGNTHVGWMIHTFSLPAFSTCPGSTLACLQACYAMGFLFWSRSTLAAHRANWERSLDAPEAFAHEMIEEIRYKRVKFFRIHVAGDFFSVPYIQAWLRIARACPRVKFLFYTRSWRVPELLPHLLTLASRPNVYAWWSEDRHSGSAILPVGRRCFLCVDAADEALIPPGVDLVFRDDTRAVRKWAGGVWVCPKENGAEAGITCSSCLWCLLPGPFPVPPEMRTGGRDVSASPPETRIVSISAASPGRTA
jgi:protein gp88